MVPWFVAFALAQALDASSSCSAFTRGAIEVGPIMPHTCKGVIAVKTVTTGAYAFALRPIAKHRPILARVLTGALTAGTAIVAVRNMGVAR